MAAAADNSVWKVKMAVDNEELTVVKLTVVSENMDECMHVCVYVLCLTSAISGTIALGANQSLGKRPIKAGDLNLFEL